MRGEREHIFLLDTTLLDCVRGSDLAARRKSLKALGQALGELGIDYVAARDVSLVAPRGYSSSGVGRSDPDGAAIAVRVWQAGADRCDVPASVPQGRGQKDRPAGAGAVLLAMDAYAREERGAEAAHALDDIARITEAGREAIVEIAHFFDACRADRARALAVLPKALQAGARWVVLADTAGAGTSDEVATAVRLASSCVPEGRLGIMTGNRCGRGIANTLAALRAGCRLAGGTLTGAGRPGGQASLATLIPTLLLNSDLAARFATRVTPERLAGISHASRLLDAALDGADDGPATAPPTPADRHGTTLMPSSPIGIAGSGLIPATPSLDGAGLVSRLADLGIAAPDDETTIARLAESIGLRDRLGYGLAEADATFELVARRALGELPCYFSVVDFRVGLARRRDARGRLVPTSDAEVVLRIAGAEAVVRSLGGGKGPVDALDRALRGNLGRFQAFVRDIELTDYTVRILRRGGEAVTRVAVENRNRRTGARWLTVGVAPSIVDASLEALVDGLIYCLFKAGAPA